MLMLVVCLPYGCCTLASPAKAEAVIQPFWTAWSLCFLQSIEPQDVLFLWRQAEGIQEGTPWMAVFAVDEVCRPDVFNQDQNALHSQQLHAP